jgi:hypothetical protein
MNSQKINSEPIRYNYLIIFSIQIKAKTWARDSHGLFDYENHQVKTTSLIINSEGRLIRNKNDVKFTNSNSELEEEKESEELKILSQITLNDSKF